MNIKKILKFFAYTTAFTAIFNKVVAIVSTSKKLLNTEQGEYYLWEYGRIYYEKRGEGSPIVLLHDLTCGSSSYEFSRIVEELSETNTVYSVDLLGFGRSDKPALSYSNYLYVKFLSSFLKEVVEEPCTIVTSGNSSSFAILGCSLDSSLVKKVICINPANPQGINQAKRAVDAVADVFLSIPIYGTALYNACNCGLRLKKTFKDKYFYNEFIIEDEYIDTYCEAAHKSLRFARNVYAAERLNYFVLPVKHVLKNLNFELEIITGEEEEGINEIVEKYAKCNEDIKVNTISNTKHLPHLEKPTFVVDMLK